MTRTGPSLEAEPAAIGPATGVDLVLSIAVLFNLAIARPILDLLGRNPEFFIAHDSSGFDAVVVALVLAIGLPLVIGIVVWLTARAWRPGLWLHHVLFGVLVAALAIQALTPLDVLEQVQGAILVALALALGALGVLVFRRSELFRSFLRMGAFVPLLVLGVFIFGSRARALIAPGDAAAVAPRNAADPAPIVMVVMDEFPIASLMDGTGAIDRRLFPNFAQVAEDFTWFRDTTAVHNLTTHAVPSLLDGHKPVKGTLPTVEDHPANLFTVLGPEYEIKAAEPITDLCPDTRCRDIRPSVPASERWAGLIDDVRIVLGHILLPDDLADSLPRVDENWGGFGEPKGLVAAMAEPVRDFEALARALENAERPRLYFLHGLLPHAPWRFFPSGTGYPVTAPLAGLQEGPAGERAWVEDRWPVLQNYQRHLLQVGYVDRLVGDLLDRLRNVGLYDDALVVLTSDHGGVFQPGLTKRALTPDTIGDLASVPLFIKRPHQGRGSIVDDPAQTIDVFPTIADVIGMSLPSETDGRSLLAAAPADGIARQISSSRRTLPIGDGFQKALAAARAKFRIFDIEDGIEDLFSLAPPGTRRLLGMNIERVRSGPRFAGAAQIADASLYDDVDPAGSVVPAMISGTVSAASDEIRWPLTIAVSVNGRVGTVTQTFGRRGDTADFFAIVPPRAFVAGPNEIALFVLDGDVAAPTLSPVTIED